MYAQNERAPYLYADEILAGALRRHFYQARSRAEPDVEVNRTGIGENIFEPPPKAVQHQIQSIGQIQTTISQCV